MIAIPNMDKPKSCDECRYKMWTMNETFCNLLDKMLGDEDIRPDCPLIEIVTCGECKHWYNDADCGMACEFTNMKQPSDGFCNWGERRADEDGDRVVETASDRA